MYPTHSLLLCLGLASASPAFAHTSANGNAPRGEFTLPVALAYSDPEGIWVRRAGATAAERWATGTLLRDARLSPDGSRLAVTLTTSDRGPRAIAVVQGKGSAPKPVPGIPGDQNYAPQWSPDGQWLLFQHLDNHRWMAAVTHLDGSGYREFSVADEWGVWGAWWASDSKAVCVYSSEQVVCRSLDGQELSRQPFKEAFGEVDQASGMAFSPSPGGSRLLFDATQDVPDIQMEEGTPSLVFLKDLKTGVIRRVSPKGQEAARPAWLPDGKTFVFSSWNGKTRDLYLGHVDGSAVRLLKRNASNPSVSR